MPGGGGLPSKVPALDAGKRRTLSEQQRVKYNEAAAYLCYSDKEMWASIGKVEKPTPRRMFQKKPLDTAITRMRSARRRRRGWSAPWARSVATLK